MCPVWTPWENGGGRDKLVEPSLTVCEIFEAAWKVPTVDRDLAISLYKLGTSKRAIAKELGIARATVTRIIQTVDT
jgi:DNA invertase Pin-like site-specific DNA recombinase